jgi:Mor family transcriptional regulator
MDAVIAAVGESAARSLMHVYASSRIFIPTAANLDGNHPVARVLGMPLAHKLCAELGGGYLAIPTPESLSNDMRSEQIYRRWRAGRTTRQLARDYAISERRVQQILKREINEQVDD